MQYLHWLSVLAVWILRGGENVSKLVSIQELEENRLGCQSLFNLLRKIFPLGTLSCLEQAPKNPTKHCRGDMSSAATAKLSYIWLIACIPKSPLIFVGHLAGTLLLQSLSPCSMPTVLWPFLLPGGAQCAFALQSTWRCKFEAKIRIWLWERRDISIKTSPGIAQLHCFHSCVDITAVVAERSQRAAFSGSWH